MISNINIVNNHEKINNTNFKAIPLATYNYLHEKSGVTIYKLEKRDIGYLQHLLNNLEKFFQKYDVDNLSARQVIEEAFEAGIEILKGKKHPETKADILMSFYNGEPSSIIIGNALKVDKKGKFHYSSRKNHSNDETELDWLATWNKKIPGEGQATVYEYFCRLLELGFKQCFVRSEIPEKSSAVNFYSRMGFEKLSEKARKILRKNDNSYLIGKYDDKADKIIPMKATVMDIVNTLEEKADDVLRKKFKTKISCELPKEKFE